VLTKNSSEQQQSMLIDTHTRALVE